MTDNEIIKSYELCFAEKGTTYTCKICPYHKFGKLCRVERDRDAWNLINRLKAENEQLKDILYDDDGVNLVNYWHQQCKIAENGCKNFAEENESQKAEIERLKKKDNEWALSYANSVARGIRKREEAIKKFAEKVEDVLAPTVSALFCISETLVEASKQHISPEEALKNIRVQLSEKQPICSKLQLEEVLDRHVKEMED